MQQENRRWTWINTDFAGKSICLAVAVVALRQPRRVQRRNGSHGPLGLREAFAPLDAALLVAARRVLPPLNRYGQNQHSQSASRKSDRIKPMRCRPGGK